MQKKHALLMDIDGTLTPPRKPIEKEMATQLERLTLPFFVAAGSDLPLLEKQFFSPLKEFGFRRDFEAFLCNGTAHYECKYRAIHEIRLKEQFDIKKHLGDEDYCFLINTLNQTIHSQEFHLSESLHVLGDIIINRQGMVNFTPMGRSASKENLGNEEINKRSEFVKYDQKNSYRRRLKSYLDNKLEKLIKEKGLLILFGGQTSFDILIKGKDKTNAVKYLLERKGIEKVTFLGDALLEGGNDSVIMDYIGNWHSDKECPLNAIPVENWIETIDIFKENKWI